MGLFILRFAVGVVFMYHAIPKLKDPRMMAGGIGMPGWLVLLLGSAELLSGLSLIFEFFVRYAALILALVMVGAIYFKTMKWNIGFMAQNTTGWEFDFVLLASCITLVLSGGGSVGLDGYGTPFLF